MSATVLYMSMSLDGFIAGPNETTRQRARRRWPPAARVGIPGGEVDLEAARHAGASTARSSTS